MNTVLSKNIEKIKSLCEQHQVKSLFAFGSVCTEKFSEASDIDLLISFKPMESGDYADNYFQIAEKFERIFQRPVELLTEKSLSNPYFIQSVNQNKALLYGSGDQ